MKENNSLQLKKAQTVGNAFSPKLSASKSISNRMLMLKALYHKQLIINNLSDARDTVTMSKLLDSQSQLWDVKDAGTTMRFLTAYLSIMGEGVVITGTERMKKRPIELLVNALNAIGANIQYVEKVGYPPLLIQKIGEQNTHSITIAGNVSSQYISALLMIAPLLPRGLTLHFSTPIFSKPYIEMTLALLAFFTIKVVWEDNTISLLPQKGVPQNPEFTIENDWSGASYWFSLVALSPQPLAITLSNLFSSSIQGDKKIVEIMENFGVSSVFSGDKLQLTQNSRKVSDLKIDFQDCPDLAQTVMVVAAALGVRLEMLGLESLKIKETDRIAAMQNELAKMGAKLIENNNRWYLQPTSHLPSDMEISTYEDHRMAMAFAPLCTRLNLKIENPDVVNKSYPQFWEEIKKCTQ